MNYDRKPFFLYNVVCIIPFVFAELFREIDAEVKFTVVFTNAGWCRVR